MTFNHISHDQNENIVFQHRSFSYEQLEIALKDIKDIIVFFGHDEREKDVCISFDLENEIRYFLTIDLNMI
jgi:hypothetical protein